MKLLLVEDDPRIATNLQNGLESERYTVDLASDGDSGFDLASTQSYDAIILDYMLPIRSGLSLCKEIRKIKNFAPILMLTAKNQKEDIIACLDAGADDYLTKPFSFAELLARIRALTRRPVIQVSEILTLGDLSLDPKNYTVVRAGRHLNLSQKEYTLLAYLMRHPGVPVSKDKIIEAVWDFDADILPNTIEVYIRKLREKIDIPFSPIPSHIHTSRGFGYMIK